MFPGAAEIAGTRAAQFGAQLAYPVLAMSFLSRIPDTPVVRALRLVAIVLVLLAAAFILVAAAEAKRLHVDHREIVSETLPAEFDGAKLVFVADIHAGPNLRRDRMKALVDQVNALDPDIIVLGGDYVGGKADGASVFYPAIADLNATLGTFAVLGNHDAWEGADKARAGLSKAGITLLENESVRVRKGDAEIVVAGLEDLYTGAPDAAIAGRNVDPSDFAVLVSHNPDALDGQLPDTADLWDLALAGHTHGGQITFFGVFAPMVATQFGERFRSGWKHEDGVPILVTNGVGTVTAPLRFFARPELHVITLRRG